MNFITNSIKSSDKKGGIFVGMCVPSSASNGLNLKVEKQKNE